MEIQIQDKKYLVEVSNKKFTKENILILQDKILIFESDQTNSNYKNILGEWLKKYAKQLIFKRVKELSLNHSFKYNKISIRDQKSRWGSCSSNQNLNFNWRLILAPSEILDYVIIHELAHTKEMNHSKDFWNIVKEIIPEYKKQVAWLKTHGNQLTKLKY